MNSALFYLALLEIAFTLIFSVGIIYISFGILKRVFFFKKDIEQDNMAFTVFASGVVLSIGLILSEIYPSISNVIRISIVEGESVNYGTIVSYTGLYLLIGFLGAVLINLSVFLLFSILTRGVNEFKAIQQNRLAVSLLVVAILISITLLTKESIALLISALLPYPEATQFF